MLVGMQALEIKAITELAKNNTDSLRVTMIELGAESCRPCRAMKQVMTDLKNKYGNQISINFHDVKRDKSARTKYKVRVMPTQVFLDVEGKEIFRHEGYFPLQKIEEMLAEKEIKLISLD